MTFRPAHLIAAVVLHVLVLGLLLGGVQCSAKPHKPPVITAVLLDPSRSEQLERKRAEQKKLEQRRQAEQDRKRREEEAKRQRLAEDQKKAEAQKRAQAEVEAKKKRDAEAQRQKQLAEKKAADAKAAEQKKAEEAARRKQEQAEKAEQAAAAKRDIEERARVEQALKEEALRMEADREQQARAASEREQHLSEWAAALQAHIKRYYRIPPGAPQDFSCPVRMQLLPDGSVSNAKIVNSCGSPALDRAVEDAVVRSSPLPKPADPAVFDRDLTITFTP
jgi:colicin import membrane protein